MKSTQKIKDFVVGKNAQCKEERAEFSKREIFIIALGAGFAGMFISKNILGNRFKLKDLRSIAMLTSISEHRLHQKRGEVYKDVVDLFGGDLDDVPDNVVRMMKERGDDIEEEILGEFRSNICKELGLDVNEAHYIQRG